MCLFHSSGSWTIGPMCRCNSTEVKFPAPLRNWKPRLKWTFYSPLCSVSLSPSLVSPQLSNYPKKLPLNCAISSLTSSGHYTWAVRRARQRARRRSDGGVGISSNAWRASETCGMAQNNTWVHVIYGSRRVVLQICPCRYRQSRPCSPI